MIIALYYFVVVTLNLCICSYFTKNSFNTAMTIFLKCLDEIGNFAMSTDKAIRLPYTIDKDRIGGLV